MHLLRRIRCKWAINGLEQLGLQFRVVRLQIQGLARVEPDLFPAIGQNNNRTLMRLGNQFGQLRLGFFNGQCFHDPNLDERMRISKTKCLCGWVARVHRSSAVPTKNGSSRKTAQVPFHQGQRLPCPRPQKRTDRKKEPFFGPFGRKTGGSRFKKATFFRVFSFFGDF